LNLRQYNKDRKNKTRSDPTTLLKQDNNKQNGTVGKYTVHNITGFKSFVTLIQYHEHNQVTIKVKKICVRFTAVLIDVR
jgi:hypothetical protein